MLFIRRWLVWLSRIHCVWGFGIQSPTDYAFVRYVVNEHWPYYAYEELTDKDWLTEKLGRLYFRLANWRQPRVMQEDRYQRYWQAGCRKTRFTADVDTVELARIEVEDIMTWNQLLPKCNDQSVVVVEGIWRSKEQWESMSQDKRVVISFDLYYCGIVLFDTHRYKHHYQINF